MKKRARTQNLMISALCEANYDNLTVSYIRFYGVLGCFQHLVLVFAVIRRLFGLSKFPVESV
jgi:hypothetical protein